MTPRIRRSTGTTGATGTTRIRGRVTGATGTTGTPRSTATDRAIERTREILAARTPGGATGATRIRGGATGAIRIRGRAAGATGTAPTGTAPTGATGATGAAPTGAAPTGTAPTGAAGATGTAPTGTAPTGTAPTGATGATGTAPTGTAPTGTAPTGTAPTAPTGTAPTGAAPTGTAPTGTAPTGTAPTGAAGATGTAPTGATGTAPTGTTGATGTAPTGATGATRWEKIKNWVKNHKWTTRLIALGVAAGIVAGVTFAVLPDEENVDENNQNVISEQISIEDLQSEANVLGLEINPIFIKEMNDFKTKIGEVLGLDAELSKSISITSCSNAKTRIGKNFVLIDVESTDANGNKIFNTITIDGASIENILNADKTSNAESIDTAIDSFVTNLDAYENNGKITVMDQGKSPLTVFKKSSLSDETIKTMNGQNVYYILSKKVDEEVPTEGETGEEAQTEEKEAIFNENCKIQYLIDKDMGKVYMVGLEYNEDGSEKEVDKYAAYSVNLVDGKNPIEIIKNSFGNATSYESTTIERVIFDQKEGDLASINMALLGHSVTLTADEVKALGLINESGNIVSVTQPTVELEGPVA